VKTIDARKYNHCFGTTGDETAAIFNQIRQKWRCHSFWAATEDLLMCCAMTQNPCYVSCLSMFRHFFIKETILNSPRGCILVANFFRPKNSPNRQINGLLRAS